jgi:hypothetical protein
MADDQTPSDQEWDAFLTERALAELGKGKFPATPLGSPHYDPRRAPFFPGLGDDDELVSHPYPQPDSKMFHGIVGRIIKAIEPISEADPVAVLAQILIGFGNAVGRSPYFSVSSDKHHTNLYACVVGKSAKARKGLSMSVARWILGRIDPAWENENIRSGLSSGEGIIWQVRDPIEKAEPIKEKGKYTGKHQTIIQDGGIEDKRLLASEPEFSSPLVVMGRSGNTLSPVLRDAFDSRTRLSTMVKNSPAVATGAHISLIGHITQQELKSRMSECEMFNGFANRFLWICAARTKLLSNPIDLSEAGINAELSELVERCVWAKKVEEMERDEAAEELWQQIYLELGEQESGPVIEALTDRADALTLRLSMLYALMDGSRFIRVDHLQAAYALWKYCQDSARYLFGPSLGNPKAEKIFAALRTQPNGMTRSEIQKAVFKGNLKGTFLDEALALLKRVGWIESKTEKTAGRDAERYFCKNERN